MKQTTFASIAWSAKGKITRRERFLAEVDRVIPWARLCALIEPHYHTGTRGRPLMPLERMLRIYFMARACGEHAFRLVKQLWGFAKVRYRGLQKNTARAFSAFALANLYMMRHRLK